MPNQIFTSIPDPIPDLNALVDVVKRLKTNVDLLTGAKGVSFSNKVFVQDSVPTPLNTGDIWVVKENFKMFAWDGTAWIALHT